MLRTTIIGILAAGIACLPVLPVSAAVRPADYIPSASAPTVVERLFTEVFSRKITAPESEYWKKRARSDKSTESALKGAMYFQKAKGVSATPIPKPAATTATTTCTRTTPYPLAPELEAAMTVLKNGILSKEPWKSKLPLKKLQNCLNIKFANKESDYNLVQGALGVFLPKNSTVNDLRIIINPVFAKDGHVLLGETMIHEITHAWQFTQDTLAAKQVAGFTTYKPLDCYTKEAEAFWTEMNYNNSLAEADQNDLDDALHDAITFSPKTKQGAWQVINLTSIATTYWDSLVKNPLPFLRVNFVMTNPAYIRQCS